MVDLSLGDSTEGWRGRRTTRSTWLTTCLEAEQDRWFLWLPVLFGVGIWLYFGLPVEPSLVMALLPLVVALVLRTLWRAGVYAILVPSALVAVATGLVVGKIRTELVVRPVQQKRISNSEVAGVVGLVAAYEMVRERRSNFKDEPRHGMSGFSVPFFGGIVLATLVASVAVAPIAAFHFHKSQQFAVLANLIAVPICSVIVMPMVLVSLVAMPLGLEAWPLGLMGKGIEWMTWCATWVSGLPGAVIRIPAIPVFAFGLLVFGGLWLTLWRQRWRFWGLALMPAGLALAPMLRQPDILIGRQGGLVAVKGEDGSLNAVGGRGGTYELERWLENDGDGRVARCVLKGQAFRCDGSGCIATVKGQRVAAVRHPAGLRDDCRRAFVLALGFAAVKNFARQRALIDRRLLSQLGAHAIYNDETRGSDGITVEIVEARRGKRPWSRGVPD